MPVFTTLYKIVVILRTKQLCCKIVKHHLHFRYDLDLAQSISGKLSHSAMAIYRWNLIVDVMAYRIEAVLEQPWNVLTLRRKRSCQAAARIWIVGWRICVISVVRLFRITVSVASSAASGLRSVIGRSLAVREHMYVGVKTVNVEKNAY
jgi:hypothetical protein